MPLWTRILLKKNQKNAFKKFTTFNEIKISFMPHFKINYYKSSKKNNRASIAKRRTIINKIIAYREEVVVNVQ